MRLDALLSDPDAIHCLRLATRMDRAQRRTCLLSLLSSWDELEARAEADLFDVAFVQPTFPLSVRSPPDGLQRLVRLHADLDPGRLIVFVCQSSLGSEPVRELTSLPFSIVLVKGIDDHPRTILRALSRAWSLSRLKPWADSLHREGETPNQDLALALVTGWPPPRSVEEVANRLSVSPRTLRRWMRKGEILSPRALIRWGRLLEALALHRLGIRSRARIAAVLDLGGADTLARLARDLTGHRLEEVFRPEMEEEILVAFFQQLTA